MMFWRAPHVTICVPVHNGAAFVAETLEAIAAQTYRRFTVLVADDASVDESATICRRFTRSRKFHLTIRATRRGWIDNCNGLLAAATTDFVCIVPHDDVIAREYVEALVDTLRADPAASLAFCDMQAFGVFDGVLSQPSIRGSAAERVREFVRLHHDGSAFRGLIRRTALASAGGLRPNRVDNFAADVSWLARIAGTGALVRVPQTLYRKRYDPQSVSLRWNEWSEAKKSEAWAVHCRELLDDGLRVPQREDDRRQLVAAVLRRVLAVEPAVPFAFMRDLPVERKAALLAMLFDAPDAPRLPASEALG